MRVICQQHRILEPSQLQGAPAKELFRDAIRRQRWPLLGIDRDIMQRVEATAAVAQLGIC